MNSTLRRAAILSLLMIAASLTVPALRPTQRLADELPQLNLEDLIPQHFGSWQHVGAASILAVNPQQDQFIRDVYAQTLSRTYTDSSGYQIMLSIAYGNEQSEGMHVHKPEVCYPAQGFAVLKQSDGQISWQQRLISVKRLVTSLQQRHEPVTYWITVGETAANSSFRQKLARLSYGLSGHIPDGMLFRVSSIDANEAGAFAKHDDFINQLLDAIPPGSRLRLTGRLL